MGTSYYIVNTSKRQYLQPSRFNESSNISGYMDGHHATAVALLVCRKLSEEHVGSEGLAGTWSGDSIWRATDTDRPDMHNIRTSKLGFEGRNLYGLAADEYENISYRAVAMLCDWSNPSSPRSGVAADLAMHAKSKWSEYGEDAGFMRILPFFNLGNAVAYEKYGTLDEALIECFGADWRRKYVEAQEIYRKTMNPMPRP